MVNNLYVILCVYIYIKDSIFENIHFGSLDTKITEEIRLVSPWILWLLWKNRNKLPFENVSYPADQVVEKASEDAKHWILAQSRLASVEGVSAVKEIKWQAPELRRVKCNIDFFWNKAKALSGAEESFPVYVHP